jgi:hypothetical protein
MWYNNHRKGSVLLIVLIFSGLAALLLERFISISRVQTQLLKHQRDSELARTLALNGLSFAYHHLSTDANSKAGPDPAQLLCILNQWQTIPLTKENEGIFATIKFAITCENGKIPLSKVYSHEKNSFEPPFLPVIKKIVSYNPQSASRSATDTYEQLRLFFAKQKLGLNDPHQLTAVLDIPRYPHPLEPEEKRSALFTISLLDLFSLHNTEENVNLLYASDSTRALFDMPRSPLSKVPEHERYERCRATLEKLKTSEGESVAQKLGMLQPIIGTASDTTRSLLPLVSLTLEPSHFSVIASATVNDVTQTVIALVNRSAGKEGTTQEGYDTFLNHRQIGLERLYWVDQNEYQ